jgi:hypothetical protein
MYHEATSIHTLKQTNIKAQHFSALTSNTHPTLISCSTDINCKHSVTQLSSNSQAHSTLTTTQMKCESLCLCI